MFVTQQDRANSVSVLGFRIVYMLHITLLTFVEVLRVSISSWVLDLHGYLITISTTGLATLLEPVSNEFYREFWLKAAFLSSHLKSEFRKNLVCSYWGWSS